MKTLGTSLRGIGRIHKENLNPLPLCLVLNESAKLKEPPRRLFSSLGFLNSSPRTNALEVLKGYCSLRAFSRLNKFLGDTMVYILGKAFLLMTPVLKNPFGRLRSFLLKFLPKTPMPSTKVVDKAPRKLLSVRSSCYILDSKINPKNVFIVVRSWLLNITGSRKIKFSFASKKVRLSLLALKKSVLATAANIRNLLQAAINRPDRYFFLYSFPKKNSGVIGNSSKRLESSFRFFVKFVRLHHLLNTLNRHLSRKFILFSYRIISKFLKSELPKYLIFPCLFAHKITSSIHCFKGSFQRILLLFSQDEFNCSCQLHIFYYRTFFPVCQVTLLPTKGRKFLPGINSGDSLPQRLLIPRGFIKHRVNVSSNVRADDVDVLPQGKGKRDGRHDFLIIENVSFSCSTSSASGRSPF